MKIRVSTQVRFFSKLSQASIDSTKINVALFDRKLLKIPGFKKWLSKFDLQIPLQAGETLKSAAELDPVIQKLFAAPISYVAGKTRFYAIGGGSVGDFVGFLASTFLQGVDLVQVPTTWVSAMDSAHGGMTALNSSGVKNALMTFYPAREAWIIQGFFRHQDGSLLEEACGEAAKMALLDPQVWKQSQQKTKKGHSWTPDRMWKILPTIIAAKLRVVRADPLEKRGSRATLGLGQTLGHLLESHYGFSHGKAIGVGLFFALWVSWCEGLLSSEQFFELEHRLSENWGLSLENTAELQLERHQTSRYLLRNSKAIASGEVQFVGLSGVGKPRVLELTIDDLLDHLEGLWG